MHNETKYKNAEIKVLGNTWIIVEVSGKYNYINITKITNNPFRGPGKDYATWDDACKAYKSPEMKTALLITESDFKLI